MAGLGLGRGVRMGGRLLRRYNPAKALFGAGEQGIWLDPSDFSTMFQDNLGATPVTAVGQTVGLIMDKSQNRALGPELVANGSFASGNSGWALLGVGNTTTFNGGAAQIQGDTAPGLRRSGIMTIGKVYQVSFRVRRIVGTATPFVVPNILLPAIGSEWQTITAIRAASNANFDVGLSGAATGSILEVTDISVKEVLGNHATQGTAASRMVLGRHPASGVRNILNGGSEDLANTSVWTNSDTLNGTRNGATLSLQSSEGYVAIARGGVNIPTTGTWTFSATVVCDQTINNVPIRVSNTNSTGVGYVLVNLVAGVPQRVVIADIPVGTSTGFKLSLDARNAITPGSTDEIGYSVTFDKVQIEAGSVATAYQKVGASAWDITESGQPDCYYLAFDGVDDFLVTGTINAGADKAQAFVGMRKLSDSARGLIFAMDNGATRVQLEAPGPTGLRYKAQGGVSSVISADVLSASFDAPQTAALTYTVDAPAGSISLRINGSQATSVSGAMGSGNFAPLPLYIGRSNGGQLPFNGRIYSLIIRFGANLTPAQVYAVENFVNGKTKAVASLPAPPTVSISNAVSQNEGNSGTTVYTYTVTRTNTVGAITVPWSFDAGNTDSTDYVGGVVPSGGNLTFANGAATATITINVAGDATVETDESFVVTISAPDFYNAGAAMSATGTILNDDVAAPPPVAPNYIDTTVAPYMLFGAQRVMAGYSGPLYRIRRDSDNAEMDVYCQIAGDYPNYNEVNAWAGSAGLWVATVYDQTGNGRHIVNTILANQPRLDTSIKVAGCAPIVFDGYGRSNSGGLPQAQVAKSLTVGGLVGLVRNNMSYLTASQSQVSYNSTRYIAFRPEDNSVDTSGIELQSGLLNGQRIGGLSSLDTWGAALEASNRRYYSMQGSANQAATNPADVLQRMTIGDKVGVIAFAGMYRMFALAIYNTALSATDGANAQLSLNTAFSVPANAPYRVVFDGSSGMEGSGSTMLRNVVAQLALTKRPEMFNMGVHGQSLASIYSGRVARFSGRYTSSRPCVFFEQGGANDLFGSDTPATTLYNNTTTPLVSYLKGLGYKVVLCTIPPIGTSHSLYTTARENERLAYNDLIRANSAGADGVCDWASDPVMGTPTSPDNLTYYTGDKQHPTSEGYARYAILVRNSLETVLRSTALGADYVP